MKNSKIHHVDSLPAIMEREEDDTFKRIKEGEGIYMSHSINNMYPLREEDSPSSSELENQSKVMRAIGDARLEPTIEYSKGSSPTFRSILKPKILVSKKDDLIDKADQQETGLK